MRQIVEGIVLTAFLVMVLCILLIPWLSIIDIHRSIDRVADKIDKLTKAVEDLAKDD